MKTWRHFTAAAFLAIFFIIVGFTACDNDNGITIYTVTFDPDNGNASTVQTVVEGSKVTKPTDPTKNDYSFDYWYNVANDTKWDFDIFIASNVTLKAKWTLNPILCTCPNGTLHLNDEICCEKEGCECEIGIIGKRLENGIPITNRDGNVEDFTRVFNNIETAFGWMEEYEEFEDLWIFVQNNIKEISIVVSLPEKSTYIYIGFASALLDGEKYIFIIKEKSTMGNYYDVSDIFNIFWNFREGLLWELNTN